MLPVDLRVPASKITENVRYVTTQPTFVRNCRLQKHEYRVVVGISEVEGMLFSQLQHQSLLTLIENKTSATFLSLVYRSETFFRRIRFDCAGIDHGQWCPLRLWLYTL